MTTVSALVAALNQLDPSLTVDGAEALTVAVTTQVPVLSSPPTDTSVA